MNFFVYSVRWSSALFSSFWVISHCFHSKLKVSFGFMLNPSYKVFYFWILLWSSDLCACFYDPSDCSTTAMLCRVSGIWSAFSLFFWHKFSQLTLELNRTIGSLWLLFPNFLKRESLKYGWTFYYSFNKHLWSSQHVPGTIADTGNQVALRQTSPQGAHLPVEETGPGGELSVHQGKRDDNSKKESKKEGISAPERVQTNTEES